MKTFMFFKMILICIFTYGLSFSGLTNSIYKQTLITMTYDQKNSSYSWNADPNAVSYLIDLKNQSTGEQFSEETTSTIIFLSFLSSGTYDIVVKAKYADGSTGIIIEDMIIV